jgi:quaternary ammonium compound-resistance protein SugE
MIFSFVFLALAVKTIPLGTGYAIWTGIGTMGTVLFGILLFGEPVTVPRMVCIGLIMAGVIGLKATSKEEPPDSAVEMPLKGEKA